MKARVLTGKLVLVSVLLAPVPASAHPHSGCLSDADLPQLPKLPKVPKPPKLPKLPEGPELSEASDFQELDGATMSAPDQVTAGSTFEISWTGPDDDYDHIVMFDADGERIDHVWAFGDDWPSPSLFRAPDRPGRYELRFTNAGDVVLARRAIVVTDVEATLSAPRIVRAGSSFLIEWTGPDNEYDFVGIYDAKGTLMSREFAFGELFQSPTKFTAPSKPGTYEIRFVTGERPLTVRSLTVR